MKDEDVIDALLVDVANSIPKPRKPRKKSKAKAALLFLLSVLKRAWQWTTWKLLRHRKVAVGRARFKKMAGIGKSDDYQFVRPEKIGYLNIAEKQPSGRGQSVVPLQDGPDS